MIKIKLTFLYTDVFVLLLILFKIGVNFLTSYQIMVITDYCRTAESTASVIEANPIARWINGIKGFQFILIDLMIPALVLSFYLLYRLGYLYVDNKIYNLVVVWSIVVLTLIFFFNFLNDLIVVLATKMVY